MKYTSAIDEAALLDQLSASFGAAVIEVTSKASGGSVVRVDVHTQLEASSSNAEEALTLAKAAAASSVVLDAYPTARVSVYVWPRDRKVYMARATATWAEGSLTVPMSTYVDAALR
jgi:hypothetical protein